MTEQLNAVQAAEWLGITHDEFAERLNQRELPLPKRDQHGNRYWTRGQIETFLMRRLFEFLEIEISPEAARRMTALLRTIRPDIHRISRHLIHSMHDDIHAL